MALVRCCIPLLQEELPLAIPGWRASWLTRVGDIFRGLKLPECLQASLHNHHHVSTSRCRRRRRLFLPFQNAGWEGRESRTATTPPNLSIFPTSPTQRQLGIGIETCSVRWLRIVSLCRGQSLRQTYTEHTTEAPSLPSLWNTFYQALHPLQVSVLLLKRALHTGMSPQPMAD